MSQADAERFVERFSRVWANPEPEAFADLWAPGGRLLHPTMGRSIPRDEIPDYVRRLKSAAPDITLRPKRWAASGDDVFIEWTISMTPPDGDRPISWDGVDRFTLEGDRAREGVAYFDTSPIWARLDPTVERRGDILDAAEQRAETAV
jgi:SnoaL-like protein